jgi:protein ImuB
MYAQAREGRPAEVFLQGRRAEVCRTSGPWRTSGEWWREEEWNEDEWDVEVRFVNKSKTPKEQAAKKTGRYRIYYDAVRQGWFARGIYD